MRKCVLEFNSPTVTGRVYEPTSIAKFKPDGYITLDSDFEGLQLDKVIGTYSNMVMEADGLYCDVKLFDNFTSIPDDMVAYRTAGRGLIQHDSQYPNGYVRDFELSHVFITTREYSVQ